MKGNKRWLFWGVGALITLVVLGMVLQAIRNLLWDLSYWLPPWMVGPVLLMGAALLIAFATQIGWPWFQAWKQRQSSQQTPSQTLPPAPDTRRQAAEQSLESIDRLLDKLDDAVSREGLRQERERVAQELQRGDLTVVVFGTGSSGKTSLIRALLQEIVGEVGATMGTTTETKAYRLRLKGLKRGLQLVDTPGILESGRDGREREQEARRRASRAVK